MRAQIIYVKTKNYETLFIYILKNQPIFFETTFLESYKSNVTFDGNAFLILLSY